MYSWHWESSSGGWFCGADELAGFSSSLMLCCSAMNIICILELVFWVNFLHRIQKWQCRGLECSIFSGILPQACWWVLLQQFGSNFDNHLLGGKGVACFDVWAMCARLGWLSGLGVAAPLHSWFLCYRLGKLFLKSLKMTIFSVFEANIILKGIRFCF